MKVLKKGSEHADSVYIGRGSPWGNPYKIGVTGYTRSEVIYEFRLYAEKRLEQEPDWLMPLVGKDLVCYCAPLACHGDVLIEMIRGSE
jgi:hypothetical protein